MQQNKDKITDLVNGGLERGVPLEHGTDAKGVDALLQHEPDRGLTQTVGEEGLQVLQVLGVLQQHPFTGKDLPAGKGKCYMLGNT